MKKITLLLTTLFISSFGFAQQTISFEASEGYSLGDINGQNGWVTTGCGEGCFVENQIVTDEMSSDGTNSLKIQLEGAFPPQANIVIGGFYDYSQPINHTEATISADIYLSELNTTRYRFATANMTAEVFTMIVQFETNGDIRVVDDGAFVATGATWEAQTWYEVKMVTDGANVKYYIDGVEIYSADQLALEDVNHIRFVHDNAGGFAYLDNLKAIEGNLSTGSQSLGQVSIFPNPATDVINIKTPSNIQVAGATIYDLLGRNTGVVFANGQVDVSGLSRGVYMLTVQTSEGTLTQKVVKK